MVQKTTFFRFQAVLASKLAPTWVPKTGPKPTQNLRNRLQISTSSQDAPKMAPNLEKHPKICKKPSKTVSTWPPHGAQLLPKSIQKASPGQDFLEPLATSISIPLCLCARGLQSIALDTLTRLTSASGQNSWPLRGGGIAAGFLDRTLIIYRML